MLRGVVYGCLLFSVSGHKGIGSISSALNNGFQSHFVSSSIISPFSITCWKLNQSRQKNCNYMYGTAPDVYIDLLTDTKVSKFELHVVRGLWDHEKWGRNSMAVPGVVRSTVCLCLKSTKYPYKIRCGVSLTGHIDSSSDLSELDLYSEYMALRERLLGRYGIAVLRDNSLYKPFKIHCSEYSFSNTASPRCVVIGQFTPPEEAGGSGGGGICTDSILPTLIKDWSHNVELKNSSFFEVLQQVDFTNLLKESPYLSITLNAEIRNEGCVELSDDSESCKASLILFAAMTVVSQSRNNAFNTQNSLAISNAMVVERASIVHANRVVVDSKDLEIYFLTTVINTSPSVPVSVRVIDVIPLHVRYLLSTYTFHLVRWGESCLEHQCDAIAESCVSGTSGIELVSRPVVKNVRSISEPSNRFFMHFVHEYDIPPQCTLVLRLTGIKRFLSRETMPGDASRGVEVLPSIVEVTHHDHEFIVTSSEMKRKCLPLESSNFVNNSYKIFLPCALVTLPIPDASMPFNVLTLSSTVMAFLLGSLINALVRKSSRIDSSGTVVAGSSSATSTSTCSSSDVATSKESQEATTS